MSIGTGILLAVAGLAVVGGVVYWKTLDTAKDVAGAASPQVAPSAPAQNVGYQGGTQQSNVYGMLGKAFEAAGTAGGSWLGSGFNSGTQEGGTYGAGGDFYGWDY
jgi:hypothetical protein